MKELLIGFTDATGSIFFYKKNESGAIAAFHLDLNAERARRVVACWNACRHISTEELEQVGVEQSRNVSGAIERIQIKSLNVNYRSEYRTIKENLK